MFCFVRIWLLYLNKFTGFFKKYMTKSHFIYEFYTVCILRQTDLKDCPLVIP